MNLYYLAHAGHEHLDEVVSNKSGGALFIVGVAIVIAVVLIVGSMIYDSNRKPKETASMPELTDSDK